MAVLPNHSVIQSLAVCVHITLHQLHGLNQFGLEVQFSLLLHVKRGTTSCRVVVILLRSEIWACTPQAHLEEHISFGLTMLHHSQGLLQHLKVDFN